MRLELNDKGNYTENVFFTVPPQIHNLHPLNGSITVRSGSRVRLECRASGQPKPVVYWNRRVSKIQYGRQDGYPSTSAVESVHKIFKRTDMISAQPAISVGLRRQPYCSWRDPINEQHNSGLFRRLRL